MYFFNCIKFHIKSNSKIRESNLQKIELPDLSIEKNENDGV